MTNATFEIVRDVPRGNFEFALFDFDGTISLLREGWEGIMAPMMADAICAGAPPTPEIEEQVSRYIEESTGLQTILQMERLAEMVREHALTPEEDILTPKAYKARFNERLMEPVNSRLADLESGRKQAADFTVAGAVAFIQALLDRGLAMHIFSGTDRADVRHEAERLGVAHCFEAIWGALDTYEAYSKDKVLTELLDARGLEGPAVLVVGDGPVEIERAKAHGCFALGVASDEKRGSGWSPDKRERLLRAGADVLIPDFKESGDLLNYLFTA